MSNLVTPSTLPFDMASIKATQPPDLQVFVVPRVTCVYELDKLTLRFAGAFVKPCSALEPSTPSLP